MTYTATMELRCDMTDDCSANVTHIDQDGYAYCTEHGIERRSWMPCRKLRPHELARLQRGEPLARY
jgi:hypothetical protein